MTNLQIKIARLRWLAGKDDCVSRILSEKKEKGIDIDDQAIAIALSECGKSKKQKNSKLKLKIARLKLKKLKLASFPTSQDTQSPDFHHFTLKKLKRKGYPKTASGIMKLASISKDGKFAKYYLLDGLDTNGNGWGVTDSSIPTTIQKFVKRPFVITAREWIPDSPYEDQYDHPFIPTNRLDMILAHQEHFRVGDIVKVAKDEDNRWYCMIAIHEKYRHLPLPPFCSPAIYQLNPHEPENNISKWLPLHLAGLDRDPAYGPRVALLRGSCTGDPHSCAIQFRMAKQRKALVESVKIKPVESSGVSDEDCECPKKKLAVLRKKLEAKRKK